MKPKHIKCIVMNCVNHKDEGKFVGELCYPCHSFIVKGEGIHSQAYRNAAAIAAKHLGDSVKLGIYQSLVSSSTANMFASNRLALAYEQLIALLRKQGE